MLGYQLNSARLIAMGGILLIVIGYGMYQPAAYAAVRQFTTPKTAGMGYAMLYALMNLGGWLPTFAFLLRDKEYAGLGIAGTYWVYTGITLFGLIVTSIILTRKVVADATAKAKAALAAAEPAAPAAAPAAGLVEPVVTGPFRISRGTPVASAIRLRSSPT